MLAADANNGGADVGNLAFDSPRALIAWKPDLCSWSWQKGKEAASTQLALGSDFGLGKGAAG